jgi:uncharacterized membrane protein
MIMYNKRRLALSIFWVLLGVTLLVLSITEVLDSSMYAGMGSVLIVVGGLQIIRNIRYRKDAAYQEKVDTETSDERNRFLSMKSWSWTGYIVVLIQGIGVVVATILGEETIRLILSYSVCLMVTVYWISYLVLSRKY